MASTGVSLFFANKGYHPNITVHPKCELASWHAHEYVVDLDELHLELRHQLSEAQKHYQGPVDRCQSLSPDFKVGEKAFVKAEHFCTTRPSKKLSDKNYGPYEIIARPGTHSVTLWLPNHLRTVHPVFHLSQLELETLNVIPNRIQPPPPPIEIEDKLEYEISEILDPKIDNWRCCKLLYYVQWEGYQGTDEETLWLPTTKLDHVKELIMDFHIQYPDKPGPLPLWPNSFPLTSLITIQTRTPHVQK